MRKEMFIRKDEEAVSPVIATILMVAITVVLAAVLYIIVMSITPPQDIPPIGTFSYSEATGSTEAEAIFGEITGDPAPTNLKFVLQNDTSSGIYTVPSSDSETTLILSEGDNMGTLIYRDNANNEKVNIGDLIKMKNLAAGSEYTLKMIWVPTGDLIDETTFSTPGI